MNTLPQEAAKEPQFDNDFIQLVLDRLHNRYKKATLYDVDSHWKLGFEVAEGILLDAILEKYGYNPKQVGRNGEALVKRLIEETKNTL